MRRAPQMRVIVAFDLDWQREGVRQDVDVGPIVVRVAALSFGYHPCRSQSGAQVLEQTIAAIILRSRCFGPSG